MNTCLRRNTRKLNLAYYKGKQKQIISNKVYEVDVWDLPFECKMNISLPTGEIVTELFGTDDKYDLIALSHNKELKINEKTRVWIDKVPNAKCDNNDFIVKTYKPSINSIAIGLTRKVSGDAKDFWLSYYNEETLTNGTPYKVRINVEKNEDNSLTIFVENTDNIEIDNKTLIWFDKDYSNDLSDYNYIYLSKTVDGNITKYVLKPVEE